jgi:NodT family efflux transporter outer membrane factor (OMF) lipoprotein
MVGPKYSRPAVPLPATDTFKEAQAAGLQPAQPKDGLPKGKWWEVYDDPALNALEEQVSISNQSVLAAEAQYREAKASVAIARSALFPTVTVGPSLNEVRVGGAYAGSGSTYRSYYLPFDVSWEPDLWGNLRRGVTASVASAQASASSLENARLLYQSELAEDYFQLHGIDSEIDLLEKTQASYEDFVTLTRNRYAAGVASPLDVDQAESQLYGAESTLVDLGVQRAQYEHAIAVLIGKASADVAIPRSVLKAEPLTLPAGLPSELLERRPDIAAAERTVAAANEQIGIALSAFYPALTLTGVGGVESLSIQKWFSLPSRFWSVGPALAETLFDKGRRRAVVAQQRAAYDASVANYRQTVLTALQQVEDNLAALRILAVEVDKVQATVKAADSALTVSAIQYKAGTTNYLTVITAQVTLLNAQITAVNLQTRRLVASVQLIQAIGGGWSASELPTTGELAKAH